MLSICMQKTNPSPAKAEAEAEGWVGKSNRDWRSDANEGELEYVFFVALQTQISLDKLYVFEE